MDEMYLLWLSRIEGIGFKKANYLLEHFGSAEAIWFAEPRRSEQPADGMKNLQKS